MKESAWNRRSVLKSLGLAAVGVPLVGNSIENSRKEINSLPLFKNDKRKLKEPVKAIVCGAGGRGWLAYSSYALKYPDELQIVGVAEPIPYRRERMANAFNIPEKHQFVTWEHVFDLPKFADAIIITTPDDCIMARQWQVWSWVTICCLKKPSHNPGTSATKFLKWL